MQDEIMETIRSAHWHFLVVIVLYTFLRFMYGLEFRLTT